jgi:prephenate dehydratase
MSSARIVYFGPEGSFTHLVARQRFGDVPMTAENSVEEVFQRVRSEPGALGIVPVENSSGGMIVPTVDSLFLHRGHLFISEELGLDVKLALLGRQGEKIERVVTHFAPLQHCEAWLKAVHPQAQRLVVSSTSVAAKRAAEEPGTASIGPRESAERFGLEVLHYPIAPELPNRTQFVLFGHGAGAACGDKSGFVVALPNVAGSLYRLLGAFNNEAINLSRIQSRPIIGEPGSHLFFIEVEAGGESAGLARALASARAGGAQIDSLGSFPVRERYQC